MARRWIARGLLLCCAFTVLTALMGWRYFQLKTRVKITQFFRQAPLLFPALLDVSIHPSSAPVPPSIRKQTGDVLPELRRLFPTMPLRRREDPFSPESGRKRMLEVRYGVVRHGAVVQMPYENLNRPVWFTWSAGPSGADPGLVSELIDAVTPAHRFAAPPYQPSNGLWSRGYLYVDSRGGQLGNFR